MEGEPAEYEPILDPFEAKCRTMSEMLGRLAAFEVVTALRFDPEVPSD